MELSEEEEDVEDGARLAGAGASFFSSFSLFSIAFMMDAVDDDVLEFLRSRARLEVVGPDADGFG